MPNMTQNTLGIHCESLFSLRFVNNVYLVRRHVDWRLLPLLGLVYSVALIDRTNLGIASTAGMDQDIVRIFLTTKIIR